MVKLITFALMALCLLSCKKRDYEVWVRHSHMNCIMKTGSGIWDTTYWYTEDDQPWPNMHCTPEKADKFCRDNIRAIRVQDYSWAWQIDSFIPYYFDEHGNKHE